MATEAAQASPEGAFGTIVDIAQKTLDQEIGRNERFDRKARGQVTLAGTWYALVQAVAAVGSQHASDAYRIGLGLLAFAGAVTFGMLLHRSAIVWRLRWRQAISHKTLGQMQDDAAADAAGFPAKLIAQYRYLVDEAQKVNESRADAFESTTLWWWLTLLFGFGELIAAVLAPLG